MKTRKLHAILLISLVMLTITQITPTTAAGSKKRHHTPSSSSSSSSFSPAFSAPSSTTSATEERGGQEREVATNDVAMVQRDADVMTQLLGYWPQLGVELGWSGPPSCSWQRLSCNSLGEVTALFLSQCHLNRTIPSFLAGLSNLTSLDLSENQLVGPVPQELARLTMLYSLILSGNSFPDLPTAVLQIPSLRGYYCGACQMTGQLPDLSNISLTQLSLHHNDLEGAIPPMPSQLNVLDLHRNKLSSGLDNLQSLLYLNDLDLSNNELSGKIPKWICRIPYLYLSGNDFSCQDRPACVADGVADKCPAGAGQIFGFVFAALAITGLLTVPLVYVVRSLLRPDTTAKGYLPVDSL